MPLDGIGEREVDLKQKAKEGSLLVSPQLNALFLQVCKFSSAIYRPGMTCENHWRYIPVSEFGNGHMERVGRRQDVGLSALCWEPALCWGHLAGLRCHYPLQFPSS